MAVDIAGDAAPVVAAASGAGALATALADVTTQLLGVPLPVVLAAAAGASIARSYQPAANFGAALAATGAWWLAGCVLAPLAAWGLEQATGAKMPTNVQAGVALAVSWSLPWALPILRERGPKILEHWLDKLGGGKP